ncbi:glycoside hydrolase [Flavobacteriales bacterium]|nr:glycoside hydrolase [Flavobacteriales bacterium]
MKSFLFFFLLPFFTLAQYLGPSTTHVLSNGNSEGYHRPRVVMTASNSPFVIWSKTASPKEIKARKWNGTAFDSTVSLVNSTLKPAGFIGPEIAAKGDTLYLIFESSLHNNHVIYMKRSFDGGLSFSDTIRVSDNSNTHKFAMPNLTVREDGNPVISYMECLPGWTHWKQMVKTSFDFGTTFSTAVDVSDLVPGEPCDCCQSTLVSIGNNIFLLFRNNDLNVRNSYIAKSDDDGLTFTAAQDLDDVNWVLNACPTSSPEGAVLGDSIMVIRRNGGSGINELYKSNVNIADLQKSYFTQVESSGSFLQDQPKVATDLIYFVSVWEENRNGVKECFYNVMYPNGASLYNGVISDTATIGHKVKPDITYGGPFAGCFSIVYSASNSKEVHFRYSPIMFSVGANEIHLQNKKLLKSVDLLGKMITPESNKPFLNIYNDGTVERKVIVQ